MKVYKGTDKDIKCRGYQLTPGVEAVEESAELCSSGFRGAATAGSYGAATAGSYGAATAGSYGAATAGDSGAATSRGSVSLGENGCGLVRGNSVKARGGLGSILVICIEHDDSYKIKEWKAAVVDGKSIKPDTWYTLKNGEFVEVE